ncbi:hypothetical protein SERLADRAFT_450123 [Serpula lacrymans var. lacrymans S7.9]|uniref:Chromatin modification-related protein EAF7 n=1 Tax=Serpula lacrymans var. lacrymans (strain S7.9) TaxID=578457 RepID=F8NYY3_SERL9|nr:uncharacterized protein SERLADRAFT_450123 [Serpula lacrymans var. lacrymans S7.9]EGO23804.1 hypothetical protein SERLADRAFT_450123 [Serpula lacrymans var. lacrymans S7.9]
MTAQLDDLNGDPEFLDSVQGEISFFRSVMRARPVGLHRHFHALAIRNAIHNDTGRMVPIDRIWAKLRTCYDLDALEGLYQEIDGYDSPGSSQSTPRVIASPSPSENLSRHPYFRAEYTIPCDHTYESIIAARRLRATASLPSTPLAPSPQQPTKSRRTRVSKRGRSKLDMAGLVGGDSDSSALTQESGDEAIAFTPRDSVITATDGGTEFAEEEESEIQELSPASFSKSGRGRISKPNRGGISGRVRAGITSTSRSNKKRKK